MANPVRGEVSAVLGGERRTLCLTLGALAELEGALGGGDLAGLAARLQEGRFSARDLIAIIGAGLRGGGETLTDQEVAALRCAGGVAGYVAIVSDLLTATFAPADIGGGDDDAKKTVERQSAGRVRAVGPGDGARPRTSRPHIRRLLGDDAARA